MITKKYDRDAKRIRDKYAKRCSRISVSVNDTAVGIDLHFGEKVIMVMIFECDGKRYYDHQAHAYSTLSDMLQALDNTVATLRSIENRLNQHGK